VRVVAARHDGSDPVALLLDLHGRYDGRGAHLHPTIECYDLAVRRRAFPRALRIAGAVDLEPLRRSLFGPDDTPARPPDGTTPVPSTKETRDAGESSMSTP
jgi:predicted RNA-binding protein YlxR (DUF448 family)